MPNHHSQLQKTPVAWQTREDIFVTDCRVFKLYTRRCYHPQREVTADFTVISSPAWVQAIAQTPDGKLVMVNQWRFGMESFSWEMPGGLVDDGEDIVESAKRELVEETGYTGKNPRIIATCSPNPAVQNNKTYFVLFEDCTSTDNVDWDTHEEIEMGVFSRDDIRAMVADGRIHNAITFNALYFLDEELRKSTS